MSKFEGICSLKDLMDYLDLGVDQVIQTILLKENFLISIFYTDPEGSIVGSTFLTIMCSKDLSE